MTDTKSSNPVLEGIRNDVRIMGTFMRDLSMHVINEEISRFPVFVAYTGNIDLGRPFFNIESQNLNWNYNASILEEFVKRGVVQEDKVDAFTETYGDPEERACIFVVTQEAGGFVFVPYEIAEDVEENPLMPMH
ncbi:MAG TPA: hypothetical protein ENJ82_11430 [Bacteroidetes bacterium]|nr:hypothetical protein [Bacteroidota bacterium]